MKTNNKNSGKRFSIGKTIQLAKRGQGFLIADGIFNKPIAAAHIGARNLGAEVRCLSVKQGTMVLILKVADASNKVPFRLIENPKMPEITVGRPRGTGKPIGKKTAKKNKAKLAKVIKKVVGKHKTRAKANVSPELAAVVG